MNTNTHTPTLNATENCTPATTVHPNKDAFSCSEDLHTFPTEENGFTAIVRTVIRFGGNEVSSLGVCSAATEQGNKDPNHLIYQAMLQASTNIDTLLSEGASAKKKMMGAAKSGLTFG